MTSWLVLKSAHEWLVLKRPVTLENARLDVGAFVLAAVQSLGGIHSLLKWFLDKVPEGHQERCFAIGGDGHEWRCDANVHQHSGLAGL
jgi:hypothetical protein